MISINKRVFIIWFLKGVNSGSYRLMINITKYDLNDQEAKLIEDSRKLSKMQISVVIQVAEIAGAKLDMWASVSEQKKVAKLIATEAVQNVADWRKLHPMKPRQ